MAPSLAACSGPPTALSTIKRLRRIGGLADMVRIGWNGPKHVDVMLQAGKWREEGIVLASTLEPLTSIELGDFSYGCSAN